MGPNAWQTIWLSDYSASHFVEVCTGQTFFLNVKAKSLYNNKPYYCQVWVDWDNDGAFSSAEIVYTSPGINTHPNINITNIPITVPAGQPYGAFRMRIRFKDNTPFVATDGGCTYTNPQGIVAPYGGYTGTSTGSYTFSDEIEDYSVRVNCGNTTGGGGNLTYSWSPPDGLDDTSIPDPTATPTQTTTYTVTVTDTDNGCTGTAQVTVTVPVITPTFDPIDAFCSGTTAPTLPATSTNNITGTWSPATVSNTTSGSYTFTSNGGQCAVPVSVSVTVNPNPTVIVTNAAYCINNSGTLTASGVNTYTWSPATGLNTTTGATVTTTVAASTTYTVTGTDANGCTNSQTIQDYICVYAQPEASFFPKPAILDSYPWEAEMVNNSSNATNYTWSFGDETPTSNEENPLHVYPGETSGGYTIMLVASNDAGCVDTTYGYVKVREELIFYVPNTFTPDGDQFNNTFFPVFTSGYDVFNYELLIFNRWGEMIFESHNTDIGWDGTYKGAMVQDGTYTWKIKVKVKDYDEHKQFVGHVNMIR